MSRSPWWALEAFDRTIRGLLWDSEATVAPYVAPGDRVADLGCGVGFHAIALSRLVGPRGEVVLVDVQQEVLRRAVDRCRRDPLARAPLTPVLADIGGDLPINGELDFALVFWALHEVEEPKRFWRQLVPHLRAGAKVLVAEPILHVHRRRYEDQLRPAQDMGLARADVDGIAFTNAAVLTAVQ
ncbi:MAG: class I SAM-dependent methyltransferase [Armatimonadota bacterium]